MIPSGDRPIPRGESTGSLKPCSNKIMAPSTALDKTDQI